MSEVYPFSTRVINLPNLNTDEFDRLGNLYNVELHDGRKDFKGAALECLGQWLDGSVTMTQSYDLLGVENLSEVTYQDLCLHWHHMLASFRNQILVLALIKKFIEQAWPDVPADQNVSYEDVRDGKAVEVTESLTLWKKCP